MQSKIRSSAPMTLLEQVAARRVGEPRPRNGRESESQRNTIIDLFLIGFCICSIALAFVLINPFGS